MYCITAVQEQEIAIRKAMGILQNTGHTTHILLNCRCPRDQRF